MCVPLVIGNLAGTASAAATGPDTGSAAVTNVPAVGQDPVITRVTGTVIQSDRAAAAQICEFSRFGHKGRFICDTILRVIWSDGHEEYFGIGTDYAVWHITASFSNWRSMGGSASDTYNAFYSNGLPTVQVYVSWASHVLWCSSYRTSWSSWYAC